MDIACIKYLCLDLDGTLLDSKKNISEEAKRMILDLKNKGVIIILASGRHFFEMKRYIRELELGFDHFAISCDGIYTYRCDGTKLFTGNRLTKSDIEIISNHFSSKDILFFTSSADFRICHSLVQSLIYKLKFLRARRSIFNVFYRINRIPTNIEVEKIRIDNISDSIPAIIKSNYTVHLVQTDGNRVEILKKGVNKFSALYELFQYKYIESLHQLLYCGNDDNDRECFENLKYTISMQDAPEELKRMAYKSTEDSDHNGVYKAIIELCKDKKILFYGS